MREIDLIPIRLHKGEPTWEIIDELLEHIDSLAGVTPEDLESDKSSAYSDGYENGKYEGMYEGLDSGYADGYSDGFDDGKRADD